MPEDSNLNTDEKNSNQTSATIAATAPTKAATRMTIIRVLALRRSFNRALKSTTFGRVITPSAPEVSSSVLAIRSSLRSVRASTNPPDSQREPSLETERPCTERP